MRILVAVLAVAVGLAASAGAWGAEEAVQAAAAMPDGALPAEDFADVRAVDPVKYFSAKQNHQPIRLEDTLELIRQNGHHLELALQRWSIDNSPQDPQNVALMPVGQAVSYFPAFDQLDQQLNDWDAKFGSYTGKAAYDRGDGLYVNPLTAQTLRQFDGHAVPWGWTPEAAGNFSYLYQLDAQGHVVSYRLCFYGPAPAAAREAESAGSGGIMELAGGEAVMTPARVAGLPWYCNGQPLPAGS